MNLNFITREALKPDFFAVIVICTTYNNTGKSTYLIYNSNTTANYNTGNYLHQ